MERKTDKAGKLFVISAPSGTGKTTLTRNVLARVQPEHDISRVVTYTSRTPRLEEKADVDYHFISEPEFAEKAAQNFFLEWSRAYGAYYGSPLSALENLACGMSLIMILDLAGALNVIQRYDPVSIWISPPGIDVLRERLNKRGPTDPLQDLRLKLAQEELEHEALSRFTHRLANIDLHKSVDELENIIRTTLQR